MRFIPLPQLYRSLYSELVKVVPDECESRLKNLVYLMIGIVLGRSVQLGRIAAYVPLRVKKLSIVRRLERFLDNPGVGSG
jgi:hypothetical protein